MGGEWERLELALYLLHSGGWFWEGGGNEKGGETEMTRQFKFIYKKRNIQEHMQITGIFFIPSTWWCIPAVPALMQEEQEFKVIWS